MSVAPGNPFWDFSLAVYRRAGVADACIRLQDEAGVDVNLLLFVCWLATVRDRALDEAEVRDLVARTEGWRDRVVRPLRAVRRWMKGREAGLPPDAVASLRSEVKRVELESERLQQDMLYAAVAPAMAASAGPPEGDSARRHAEANTALYLSVIGAPRTVETGRACHTVIGASVSG
jgi:uncharacterized protein (TIGR02444 family)